MEDNPRPDTPDVAALMAEIQSKVSQRAGQLEGFFERLRAIAAPICAAKDFSHVNAQLGAANHLYETLRDALPGEQLPRPAGISFEDLARVPGASRPWTSPKRWAAAAMNLIFGRQERFNLEVLRCLQELAHARRFDDHFDVTVRLIASFNAMTLLAMENDRLLAEFSSQLTAWLTSIMDYLDLGLEHDAHGLPEPSPPRAMADAPGAGLPARGEAAAMASQVSAALGEIGAVRTRLGELASMAASQVGALATRMEMAEHAQAAMEQRVGEHADALCKIGNVVAGLQSRLAAMAREPRAATTAAATAAPAGTGGNLPAENFDFYGFEEETRGTEGSIADEQARYLPWFDGASNVLDAGCGRGEFLELLRNHGIDAHGIDSDHNMVEHCRGKNLRVEHASLFQYLQSVEDESLGGIFLGMVIEHLPVSQLAALPALAMRKLKPGAAIVMETINPTCLTTFSGAFYADPTHVRPVHPRTVEFFLESAGYTDVTTIFSAMTPESGRLAALKESAPVDAPIKELLSVMNDNIGKLNSVLFSYGNYATAGRKPAEG